MTKEEEIKAIDQLFDRLFPICRSITGPGLRETLDILGEYMPLERFNVKTGTKLLNNWVVPKEWRIHEAWVKGPDGEKIVDFNNHNLHVVNYSIPVDKKLSLNELKEHLYTDPKLPNAIPYVTSYYNPRWGFCMKHNDYEKLKDGEYHAYIDSELIDGQLDYAHTILPGESDKEILISTYICHPSMAINELSGPIVATFLYKRLAQWKNRRFTYRFVFNPETIGAIAYLYEFGLKLKKDVYSGAILTCVGGMAARGKKHKVINYKLSKRGDSSLDKVFKYLVEANLIEGLLRRFTPASGSDERHYCAPGFNLPVGQFARRTYGFYGYHTSIDNKEVMKIKSLYRSLNEIELILKSLELEGFYLNQEPYGEVKLDEYGIYPDLGDKENRNNFIQKTLGGKEGLKKLLTILNYSDGEHTLLDIAKEYNWGILELKDIVNLLKEKGLLKGPYFKEEVEPLWK